MKSDILNALKSGADTAAAANKKLGDAVLKHICDNVQITYGWAGVLPPPASTPDPVVLFSASVSGGGTLTPSGSVPEMLLKLAALIKGLAISPAAGFALTPLAFNPAGALAAAMAGETTQEAAIQHFCEQIIASFKLSFINPSPASGTHGTYTGATIGMVIT